MVAGATAEATEATPQGVSANYRLTPTARSSYREIVAYVERDFGVRVAEEVFERLEAAFRRLAETPGLGHVREDITLDERILFWSVAPTLIAYRRQPGGIEILFVERAERDWHELLRSTP